MRQAEAQRHLRQICVFTQVAAQGVHVLHDLLLAIAAEIPVTEIAIWKLRGFIDAARESAFVQKYAGEHSDILAEAEGKQAFLGSLIEDVIDHLDRIDEARANRAEAGI